MLVRSEWKGKSSHLLFYVHHALGFIFASPHFYSTFTERKIKKHRITWGLLGIPLYFFRGTGAYNEDENTGQFRLYAEKCTVEEGHEIRNQNKCLIASAITTHTPPTHRRQYMKRNYGHLSILNECSSWLFEFHTWRMRLRRMPWEMVPLGAINIYTCIKNTSSKHIKFSISIPTNIQMVQIKWKNFWHETNSSKN